MWTHFLIPLFLVSLTLLILPEVSSERNVTNTVIDLQGRIKKIVGIILDEDLSEAEEKELEIVKETVVRLERMNAELDETGSKIPQENIDEWTKEADDILNETERKGGREKRALFRWFRRFVRRVRSFVNFVCYVIRC